MNFFFVYLELYRTVDYQFQVSCNFIQLSLGVLTVIVFCIVQIRIELGRIHLSINHFSNLVYFHKSKPFENVPHK